jgi:hypothetical protein
MPVALFEALYIREGGKGEHLPVFENQFCGLACALLHGVDEIHSKWASVFHLSPPVG